MRNLNFGMAFEICRFLDYDNDIVYKKYCAYYIKKQNTFIPYTVWQRKGNINHGSRPSIDISINLILKQSVFQKYANSPTLNSIT